MKLISWISRRGSAHKKMKVILFVKLFPTVKKPETPLLYSHRPTTEILQFRIHFRGACIGCDFKACDLTPSITQRRWYVSEWVWRIRGTKVTSRTKPMYPETWWLFVRTSSIIWGEEKPTRCYTTVFIELVIHSTCFGHYYAHHQELETIQMVSPFGTSPRL
jgi:hypothetical protein